MHVEEGVASEGLSRCYDEAAVSYDRGTEERVLQVRITEV